MQEKKLLDLPKLLDICAIYGHENEDLIRSIVTNAIQAQPSIHDSFSAAISHFLSIVHTMYERCTTSIEVLLSSPVPQDDGSTRLRSDYLEVMDFINDAIVSMDALISAYKQAALYFSCPVLTSYGSDELLKILARLHDSLLPTLQQGFQIIFTTKKDDMLSKVGISLKILSSRITNFSWNLLNLCYLSEELFKESILIPSASKIFPAQVEDPTIRADILIQTFREISEECSTIKDGTNLNNTLLQSIENNYQLINRLEILQNERWISMDNEQLKFLSGIISVSTSKSIPHLSSNKAVEMDEDDAIIESKISQVKDLFPDYGKGFISACLDVYNNNPEEVIQRILEGTLHSDLLSLDTSLAVVPPKTAAPSASIKDKGKGKLVEDLTPAPAPGPTSTSTSISAPANVLPQSSSSSSSSVGRFIRKSTTNVPDNQFLNSKDETANSFALQSMREYEDEYDDSFDDLGLGVGDSGLDDLNEKVNSSETSSASDAYRWGSRQKPQFFVKDGKNYSYKVSGSVAAANYNEASIVNQAQKGMIHGLGKGGNFPLGAAQKIMEVNEGVGNSNYNQNVDMKSSERQYEEQHQVGGRGKGRGWGRGSIGNSQSVTEREDRNEFGSERGRGGRGRGRRGGGRGIIGNEQNVLESNEGEDGNEFGERGRGGRGRGGRRGGGRTNHYRKDQAMKKHFSGLGGF
ncbi:uncharacterized protein [Rutidosis leptorrhynchoides]|uniref:uncharacterized protein isoform X2 n=1 Tax=Rutidosis leptorrhynchoides TaxID=125765 RepID=UPI003A994600